MSSPEKTSDANGRLWTIQEVANFLGVSVKTVYHWVKQERIPVTKIDGRNRFDRLEIDKWLARSTTKPRRAA
jgi:excisionase family DNA binding protein